MRNIKFQYFANAFDKFVLQGKKWKLEIFVRSFDSFSEEVPNTGSNLCNQKFCRNLRDLFYMKRM